MIIENIPQGAQEVVNAYLQLKISNTIIQTPYYINARKQRAGLRVMIGKGSPEEIIQETLIFAKLKGVNLINISESDLRAFMSKVGIGIECSGFVTYVLDAWLLSQGKKHLWNYLKFPKESIFRWLVRKIRPVENISAYLLTGDLNTEPISNIQDVKPGDLVRSVGIQDGYHIAIITKVVRDEGNNVLEFEYAHSTKFYDDKHGVRIGKVIVTNPTGGLTDQNMTDVYNGHNWLYEELVKDSEYAGIRRLKTVPLY